MRVTLHQGKLNEGGAKIIGVDKSPFVIGREGDCDLTLSNSDISRCHASIEITDGEVSITDQNSKNGTFVNGAIVTEKTILKSGQRVRFGSVSEFEVLFSEE